MRFAFPLRAALVGLSIAALAGCAIDKGRQGQPGAYKVGNPYQIAGVWYYPKEDPFYDETGVASWYGSDFHGKATANGERYDMETMTAAHRTLPMPSIVRVTSTAGPLARLPAALASAGATIDRLRAIAPSLEDTFISLLVQKHDKEMG